MPLLLHLCMHYILCAIMRNAGNKFSVVVGQFPIKNWLVIKFYFMLL